MDNQNTAVDVKLILVEKIEKGLEQANNGKVISEDELDKETEQWFK